MVQRYLSMEFRTAFVSLYHIVLPVIFPAVFSFILAHSPVCWFLSCIQWSTWSFLLTSISLWDQTSCTLASLNENFIASLFTWSVIIHHLKFRFRINEIFCEHLKSLVMISILSVSPWDTTIKIKLLKYLILNCPPLLLYCRLDFHSVIQYQH